MCVMTDPPEEYYHYDLVFIFSPHLQPLHLVLAQQVSHFLIVNLKIRNANQKPAGVHIKII